jgi:bifunctional UDP-N-acetylglucosamine pyrophosphorylase / glucosamine-1-phosphate N-acetyltransferase
MPIVSLERDSKSKTPARMQNARHCLAIVLAAGEGKRMRSTLSKTLHPIAGLPMISHVITTVRDAGADRIAVVVGPKGEGVAAAARRAFPKAEVFEQSERRGTAHAVLVARAALARASDDVLVVFGDTPLIEAATLSRMRGEIAHGADCVVLGFEAPDPTGYGRLIRQDGALLAIREERDASRAERAITLCNGGLMGFSARQALPILERISDGNAQQEFYLSDAVEIARAMGLVTRVIIASETEVMGVNDRIQLAAAEAKMQSRIREAAMRGGVTLIAPELVFFSHDTQLGRDVVVEPHVVFGPGVVVEKCATIRAFSHIEGAHVGAGTIIGPFARLRPGADIGEGAHVGNFVEVKNTHIGRKAKANHLAYLGDSTVGEGANIGAGTITCNYDGFDKHRTHIGDGAFIGTNSSLVAPVTIGEGAYIGSGSVITDDVPRDALALGRARQANKAGWAKTFREKKRRQRKT